MTDKSRKIFEELIFTNARSHNEWLDRDVSEEILHKLYDLMKWGPTSANCSPSRLIFIKSQDVKETPIDKSDENTNIEERKEPQIILSNI